MKDPKMKITEFYKDKYALWIDLRTTSAKNVFKDGKTLMQTQSGVLLEIKRTATTKDLTCHIFVLSDAILKFSNGDFTKLDI